jgi:hypothetical protein
MSRNFELESLSSEMFSPLSEKEASLVVGGQAEPIAYTGWLADTYLNGTYIGTDIVIDDKIVPLDAADVPVAA